MQVQDREVDSAFRDLVLRKFSMCLLLLPNYSAFSIALQNAIYKLLSDFFPSPSLHLFAIFFAKLLSVQSVQSPLQIFYVHLCDS